MSLARGLMRFWFWLSARARRALCRSLGCIDADARWIDGARGERLICVTVHCHRCWRRYTPDEQQQAALRHEIKSFTERLGAGRG